MQSVLYNRSLPATESEQDPKPGRTVRRPSNDEPLVLTLKEVLDSQKPLVGGKAANLAALMHARLPVPPGFCVTTAAFGQFLNFCPKLDDVSRILPQLAAEQPGQIADLSEQISACLAATPMPPRVEAAILSAWREQGEERSYAVRSSATVEDAADHSFAGQFESFLNVRGGDALLDAIQKCWRSLFSARALAYQAKEGLPVEKAAMAVVVQVMVPAEAAGVLFTVDPVSGNARRMVIEGAPGLGDQLVSGKVNPDRVVLDKATLRVIERRRATEPPCLDGALARRLGGLGLEAERLFGGPQDIEWAVSRGQVFLLQSRPITALPAPAEANPEVWTNANVMEALPDVVTPMSWSLMQILLHEFLYPLMRRMGLEVGPPPLVDLIAGRAYLNVGGISGLVRKIGPIRVDVATAFGGKYPHLKEACSSNSPSRSGSFTLRNLGLSIRIAAWLLPGLFRQQRLLERWGQRVFGELAHTPPASLSDEQLARFPRTLLQLASLGEGERTWAAAAWMGVCAIGGSMAVFQLARRWLDDRDGSLANRLLAGAGNMNSAENGLALYRLASWAKERPAVAQSLLAPGSYAELERRLPTVASGPEFLDRWRTFMLDHGHQARGGMDPAQPRWSELPDHVLDLLRACLQVAESADPVKLQAWRLKERAELVADCRRRLRNPLKRAVLLFLVRASHRGLMQRENVKNEGVRLIAILRRAMLEAGRRLRERGVLRVPEELFFLKLAELEPVLCGHPAFDVSATLEARKAEHIRHEGLMPPPVIVGRYDANSPLPPTINPDTKVLRGVGVSPGVVTGRARVIVQADTNERVLPGEILVAPYTDPGWTPYFLPAAGIVVDIGGLLSHGSVVAREYGLPAVVNVGPATQIIRTGDMVQVDGNRGQVAILERVGTGP